MAKRASGPVGADDCCWAIASARHGRRRVALPVERERPAAAAAAARSARIHQSASQRPNACRRQRTAPRASAQRVAGGACKERVVWLTPGRRPAARASQTRSRPTGGGSPGWSANQGSHEPTPTAFLSVERRATTTPAASHFWISRRTLLSAIRCSKVVRRFPGSTASGRSPAFGLVPRLRASAASREAAPAGSPRCC